MDKNLIDEIKEVFNYFFHNSDFDVDEESACKLTEIYFVAKKKEKNFF